MTISTYTTGVRAHFFTVQEPTCHFRPCTRGVSANCKYFLSISLKEKSDIMLFSVRRSQYFTVNSLSILFLIRSLLFSTVACNATPSRPAERSRVTYGKYAKFCLICQKICEREAISSANDFLYPPKFLQAQRDFQHGVCYLQTADCRPQTADCRLRTADCMSQQDCKLNETKNILIKVASSSTLPCSEK